MNAADIQAQINIGNGYAAAVLGQTYTIFRPAVATVAALDPANQIATLPIYLDPDPRFGGQKFNAYAHPVWAAQFDRTTTQVGDYLQGPGGTFFVIAQQSLLPTACVECNHTVTLTRPGVDQQQPGPDFVGGGDANTRTPIAVGFPASILQGTKGEKTDAQLSEDTRAPWYSILLPAIPGQTILTDDEFVDENGIRYAVSSTELSDLGWRLTAQQEGA